MSRFDYVKYDEQATTDQAYMKGLVQEIERTLLRLHSGRATSIALTKLEEVYMWIGKAIRDEQIARNGTAPLEESRKND